MDYVAIKLVESYCSSDRTLFVSFGCLRYLKFFILIYLILIIVTVCYNESTYNFLSQKDKDRSDMKERQISFGQSTCCLILARRTGSTHPPIQEFSNCCSLIWFLFGPGGTEQAHLFLCPPTYTRYHRKSKSKGQCLPTDHH